VSKYLVGVAIALAALIGPVGTAGAKTYGTFTFTASQVTFSLPVPSCRTVQHAPACEWMLIVMEHDLAGTPVVGQDIGTSGDLVVPYPAFCGVIQVDALVGTPAHWRKVIGHQRTIATCPVVGSTHSPPPTPGLAVGGHGNSTTAGPGESTLLSLPFTGTPVEALLLGGLSMIGLGFLLTNRRFLAWLLGE
jgi:hypothetical protein